MKRSDMTLVLVYDDQKVLLGMKKRGFGVGKWNGFGGKLKKDEDVAIAAHRELMEESGLKVYRTEHMRARGRVRFVFEDKRDEVLIVHFFSVHTDHVSGSLGETEEMRPQWFAHDEIPYDQMWIDDRYWMPHLLEGKDLSGEILFTPDGKNIIKNTMCYS